MRITKLLRSASSVGLLAAAALVGGGLPVRAAEEASSLVAAWPESSKLTALAMIEEHGQPQRGDEQALTWLGINHARRTVVHRATEGNPAVEQVVLYRVPEGKVDELTSFDPRITINRDASELSVLTDNEQTNFLVLNLAHEIASDFTSVDDAKEFYQTQLRLAKAGKSSRYRKRILFEDALPVVKTRDGSPLTRKTAP